MGEILIFIVRRLRAPLITLIGVYAISVFGLAMIPGRDADGLPVEMSYFHALYVMSCTATTIGFGEIPHTFTDTQRRWVFVCIYQRPPIVIAADARIASVLEDAGIRRPECRALLALAGDDATNQAIAIGARTLQPELPTLARVKSPLAQANLEAFGGIAVVNPYETRRDASA